jgi:glycosyltransferase involved in cell wall biosynthesis
MMNTVQVMRSIRKKRWGGIESLIIETGSRLNNVGHPTAVYCSPKRFSTDLTEMSGVPIKQMSVLPPHINEPNISLIHWHQSMRLAGFAHRCAKRKNIPYVMSFHNGIECMEHYQLFLETKLSPWKFPEKKEWIEWFGFESAMKDADALLFIGRDELKIAREYFPDKRLIYAPNGVNCNHFLRGDGKKFREKYQIPKSAFLITCIARIDRMKNQLLAVQALNELNNLYSNSKPIYLTLIGSVTDPEYSAKIQCAISELGLEQYVKLIPGVDGYDGELVDAYHAADIFVLASHCEPFGIVILEAWASKIPVIATNAGGVPYFVDNEINGLLFEPQDLQGLVNCLVKLIENDDYRSKIALAGFEKVNKEFDWDVIVKRQIQLYEEIISSRVKNVDSNVLTNTYSNR